LSLLSRIVIANGGWPSLPTDRVKYSVCLRGMNRHYFHFRFEMFGGNPSKYTLVSDRKAFVRSSLR
jgi:hypothetical protein